MPEPAEQREAERKYSAPEGFELPDVPEHGSWSPAESFTLRAEYFDTPEHLLTAGGWVLRRREGGHDDGWHLKTPAVGDVRREIALPLSGGGVPTELRRELEDAVGVRPLLPVATLTTRREERSLVGAEGRARAIACVDAVTSASGGRETGWREVEVELDPGEPLALLDALQAPLLAAGLVPAEHGSKIERALAAGSGAPAELGPRSPAGDLLLAYLAAQVGVLQAREADVLRDGPDAVHKSRVAARRMRSALKVYGSLIDREFAKAVSAELKWLGEMLGAPRDAEVLAEHLAAAVDELDPADVEGPVAQHMTADLASMHDDAHRRLVEAMRTPRHAALQRLLMDLLARRPVRDLGLAPAEHVMGDLLDEAIARVADLVARADAKPGELERWHDVRKAAKAVRYCAEVQVPAFGEPAERMVAAWTEVTEALGAVQDSVVAYDVLGDIAWEASLRDEPVATYGVLQARQLERRKEALDRGRDAVHAALNPALPLVG